jgi:hypothetical protein
MARARKDATKFDKDAAVLAAALARDPTNARYAFHLRAELSRCRPRGAGARALRAPRHDGRWDEKVWYSLFQCARLGEMLHKERALVIDAYPRAYEARPTRSEPRLVMLARSGISRICSRRRPPRSRCRTIGCSST